MTSARGAWGKGNPERRLRKVRARRCLFYSRLNANRMPTFFLEAPAEKRLLPGQFKTCYKGRESKYLGFLLTSFKQRPSQLRPIELTNFVIGKKNFRLNAYQAGFRRDSGFREHVFASNPAKCFRKTICLLVLTTNDVVLR